MTETRLSVGETHFTQWIRLQLPDGAMLVIISTPLNTDVAGRLLGSVTDEYALITPVIPPGRPYPFMQDFTPPAEYVAAQLALPARLSTLVSRLIPLLVRCAPGDEIAAQADLWWREQ
jgi:hypothetical protein